MGRRVNRIKEPEGFHKWGTWKERDPEHLPGSFSFVRISELQTGLYGAQRTNNSCSLLAVAPDNLRIRVSKDGNFASTRMFDPLTGMPMRITVTTKLSGTDAVGVLGWTEKIYAEWLKRTGQVGPGKTAWDEMADGVDPAQVIKAFTGRDATTYNNPQQLPTIEDVELARAMGQTVIVWSYMTEGLLPWNHALRVTGVSADGVTLQDPRGVDGPHKWGNPNDGTVFLNREQWTDSRIRMVAG